MAKKQETDLVAKEDIQDVSVETLIGQAIRSKVSVDTMERLLAMRKELKQEYAKEQFDRAMADFQAECPTIVKTKEVKTKSGMVAYRYAPIESIVQQVSPFLQKHGFSYSTSMELMPSGVKVAVKVTHKNGHSELSPMEVPLGNKTDIMSASQVVAAAQTFAKRYAFCNAFGILTGDDDNDGAVDSLKSAVKPQQEAVLPPTAVVSDKTKIATLVKRLNMTEPISEKIKAFTGLELIEGNYPEIVDKLEFIYKQNKEGK